MGFQGVQISHCTSIDQRASDLNLALGLPWILPMLELLHTLIKFAKIQDIFTFNISQHLPKVG